MPFGWAAAAGAVAGIGGSLISAGAQKDAASSAAQAQENAAAQADATQLQMFNQTQQNLAPYQTAGTNALTALQGQIGLNPNGTITPNAPLTTPFNYQASPALAPQLQAGTNAVLNNASATGGVFSGNTLRALQGTGQQLGSQDYWNQYNAFTQRNNTLYNQLSGLAGQGQSAAAGVSNAGVATGNSIANNLIGAGNAQAAGIIGGANAFTQGINNSVPYLSQYLSGLGGGNSYNYNGASGGFIGGTSLGGQQV